MRPVGVIQFHANLRSRVFAVFQKITAPHFCAAWFVDMPVWRSSGPADPKAQLRFKNRLISAGLGYFAQNTDLAGIGLN